MFNVVTDIDDSASVSHEFNFILLGRSQFLTWSFELDPENQTRRRHEDSVRNIPSSGRCELPNPIRTASNRAHTRRLNVSF